MELEKYHIENILYLINKQREEAVTESDKRGLAVMEALACLLYAGLENQERMVAALEDIAHNSSTPAGSPPL